MGLLKKIEDRLFQPDYSRGWPVRKVYIDDVCQGDQTNGLYMMDFDVLCAPAGDGFITSDHIGLITQDGELSKADIVRKALLVHENTHAAQQRDWRWWLWPNTKAKRWCFEREAFAAQICCMEHHGMEFDAKRFKEFLADLCRPEYDCATFNEKVRFLVDHGRYNDCQ